MHTGSKTRLVFLCSGGGGNLRFVHEACLRNWLPDAEIAAVITDRVCPANDYAFASEIETSVIDLADEGQAQLAKILPRLAPDVIVTTVHKVLRPNIVDAYRGKLVNLHYSLLPAFGGIIGMRPVKAALAFGACFTGVTAHLVDETVDGGRPLVQAVIPLSFGEEFSTTLSDLVFRCGCLSLTAAIDRLIRPDNASATDSVTLLGRTCHFSGNQVIHAPQIGEESFWSALANSHVP